ncbi:MAG: DUF502 domain-containing protein [Planctomycetota bacterium]|jgi:uncharacterized membrane protein
MTENELQDVTATRPARPIRTAVFRGLAVVLPPLLTLLLFLWAAGVIKQYVYNPVTGLFREVIVYVVQDVRQEDEIWHGEVPDDSTAWQNPVVDGAVYERLPNREYVPSHVYDGVIDAEFPAEDLTSGKEVYNRHVDITWLQPWKVIILFVSLFIIVLYLLGKFMAARVGRFFYGFFERGIAQVPFVRKVYGSVKQVSDFVFAQRKVEYSGVVAVEWPRKGLWTLSLVTGSSFQQIEDVAGEEVISVLVPTSPMPMTGFTVNVRKSETVELDISIDQAIQFIVSCGVVVPSETVEELRVSPTTPEQLVGAGEGSSSDDS